MTAIGADVKFAGGASLLGENPVATLDAVQRLGFDGILVRALHGAFPDLADTALREFAREAQRRGMFVQAGLGKVNPYMTAELPRVRDLGDGSYLAGMQRMIRVCDEYGWTQAWTATGGFKPNLPAPYCFDRFRTDVDWLDQLDAIARFLRRLAPLLRSTGVRLNLETHEEITTFEILRLIQDVGDDVLGVCLDPANLMVRGEIVGPAVRRVAPYVHMTHLRDAVLAPTAGGLSRFLMPIGEGVIDWDELLQAVLAGRPGIDLVIEGVGGTRAEMLVQPGDARWRAAHPDFSDADAAELTRLAAGFAVRSCAGHGPTVDQLRSPQPAKQQDYREFLRRSLDALRQRLATAPRTYVTASRGETT